MDKPIYFTKHAEQKFIDLAEMGFIVTREQVVEVVRQPDAVDQEADPPIAQKIVGERHLLRVVFVEDQREIIVVTFYPGARKRYDHEN